MGLSLDEFMAEREKYSPPSTRSAIRSELDRTAPGWDDIIRNIVDSQDRWDCCEHAACCDDCRQMHIEDSEEFGGCACCSGECSDCDGGGLVDRIHTDEDAKDLLEEIGMILLAL